MSAVREPEAVVAREDAVTRPLLLFFCDASSGPSRRVEGFVAQVLQRRRNHDTFRLYRIDCRERPDLARRCGVEQAPALVVVDQSRVQVRLERPRGCVEIRTALAPWLR